MVIGGITVRQSRHAWVKQKTRDPSAPYDGYDETEDTEEKARSSRLLEQL